MCSIYEDLFASEAYGEGPLQDLAYDDTPAHVLFTRNVFVAEGVA